VVLSSLEQALIGVVISALSAGGGIYVGGRNKVPMAVCEKFRENCQSGFCATQAATSANVGALMNFARYTLQEKGLKLEEINEILGSTIARKGEVL
jgi:hypothetical protein